MFQHFLNLMLAVFNGGEFIASELETWRSYPVTTPVAMVIFRRPEHTRRVLKAIAEAKPPMLLVIADGPRPDVPSDAEACAATRAVIDEVSWPCEIVRRYSDVNLGTGRGLASGLSWVFEQVEEAIILEDDCVPHPSFFRFCDELLARYRDDERVMQIAGSNLRRAPLPISTSYYFSSFVPTWGWATWRRAWQHYDFLVEEWPRLRDAKRLEEILEYDALAGFWGTRFEEVRARAGDVSYWDYQWHFACWARRGLSVIPRTNLISNIGFGPSATHTFDAVGPTANVPAVETRFPLKHPPSVQGDHDVDHVFLRDTILPSMTRRPRRPSLPRRILAGVSPQCIKRGYRQLRDTVHSKPGAAEDGSQQGAAPTAADAPRALEQSSTPQTSVPND